MTKSINSDDCDMMGREKIRNAEAVSNGQVFCVKSKNIANIYYGYHV